MTGESESIEKNTDVLTDDNIPIAERKNMVFSNCYVTKGKATVIVVSTGMNTEMGKIASLSITFLQCQYFLILNNIS